VKVFYYVQNTKSAVTLKHHWCIFNLFHCWTWHSTPFVQLLTRWYADDRQFAVHALTSDSESKRCLLPVDSRMGEVWRTIKIYWTEIKPDCVPSSVERHQRYETPQKQSHDLHLRQEYKCTWGCITTTLITNVPAAQWNLPADLPYTVKTKLPS